MRKKKQGFTLVELLVTIFIISVVLGIGSYFIIRTMSNSKEEATLLAKNNIMSSAEYYLRESKEEVLFNNNQTYVAVSVLVDKGYFTKDKVLDYYDKCVVIVKDDDTEAVVSQNIVDCDNSSKNIAEIPRADSYCRKVVYQDGMPVSITKPAGDGYSFSNNNHSDAGSYKVIAKLDDGYVWEDGTSEDKSISCKIERARLRLQLSSYGRSDLEIGSFDIQLISKNGSGNLEIKSSNNSYATAKVASTNVNVNVAKKITINVLATRKSSTYITFTVKPNNNNYKTTDIVYTIGEITKKEVAVPVCNDDLNYVGSQVQLIANNDGYVLENNLQNKAGIYDVVAKLNYGYVWADNKDTDDRTITCEVVNKVSTVTFDDRGATTSSGNTSIEAVYSVALPDVGVPERKYNVTYKEDVVTKIDQTVLYQYTFGGYYTARNGRGTKYIDSTGKSVRVWDRDEDTTLYAYWIKTTLQQPNVKIPNGYSSVDWSTESGTKVVLSSYHPTSNVTLFGTLVDSTAPQCNSTLVGTQKDTSSGWYTSDVTINYTCTDAGSGCVKSSDSKRVTTEGSNTVTGVTFKDKAGNSVTCQNKTVKIDKTAPYWYSYDGSNITPWQKNTAGEEITGIYIKGSATCNISGCSGLTVCLKPVKGKFNLDNVILKFKDDYSGYSKSTLSALMYDNVGNLAGVNNDGSSCLHSQDDNPCTWRWFYTVYDKAGNFSNFVYSSKVGYIGLDAAIGCN